VSPESFCAFHIIFPPIILIGRSVEMWGEMSAGDKILPRSLFLTGGHANLVSFFGNKVLIQMGVPFTDRTVLILLFDRRPASYRK
jgi:hypothetical protein